MVFPDAATVEALTCCDGAQALSVMFNDSTPQGLAGACAFEEGAAFMSQGLPELFPNGTASAAQAAAAYAYEQSNIVYDALPEMNLPVLVLHVSTQSSREDALRWHALHPCLAAGIAVQHCAGCGRPQAWQHRAAGSLSSCFVVACCGHTLSCPGQNLALC
jgi:hypothetical protein